MRVVDPAEAPAARRKSGRLQQDEHALEQRRIRERRRSEAEGEGQEIQDRHRAPPGKAQGDETVRQVAVVADVDRALLAQAYEHHRRGIDEGNRQHEHGHEHREEQAGGVRDVALEEGEGAHQEADEQAAAIPEEDPRGMDVEDEEPEQASHEGHEEQADEDLVERPGVDEEHERGHEGDARTEAVHVVEEVERVGDRDDPEDGEGS